MPERPSSTPSPTSPDGVRSFRQQLTVGEDAVDVTKWFPESYGIAPRVRVGRNRWFNLLWLLPIGFVVLISAVAVAQGLRTIPSVEDFIARYPGTIESAEAHENAGFPVWVGVQHFFNLFLMIFILRSGLQILSDHPRLYWTRHSTPGKDWFRFQKAGADRGAVDGEARLDQLAWTDRSAGPSALHRPGALVASRRRYAVAPERPGLLRAVVRHRPLAASRADQLGRVPQRPLGADPVPVVAVADRERVGRVQQPPVARVPHHDLRRRPRFAHHRAGHVTGAVDPVQADQ